MIPKGIKAKEELKLFLALAILHVRLALAFYSMSAQELASIFYTPPRSCVSYLVAMVFLPWPTVPFRVAVVRYWVPITSGTEEQDYYPGGSANATRKSRLTSTPRLSSASAT